MLELKVNQPLKLLLNLKLTQEENNIKFGKSEYASFKLMESGIYGGNGFTIKSIQFGASYEHGLTNVPKSDNYGKIFNRVLNFTIGYKFKLKS